MEAELLNRIVADPRIMAGKPVIRGTRLPVENILQRLAEGTTEDEILAEYDGLDRADIKACLLFGARLASDSSFLPLSSATESG